MSAKRESAALRLETQGEMMVATIVHRGRRGKQRVGSRLLLNPKDQNTKAQLTALVQMAYDDHLRLPTGASIE